MAEDFEAAFQADDRLAAMEIADKTPVLVAESSAVAAAGIVTGAPAVDAVDTVESDDDVTHYHEDEDPESHIGEEVEYDLTAE